MESKYQEQVRLLLRIAPEIAKIEEFALHGGTAINLFPGHCLEIEKY